VPEVFWRGERDPMKSPSGLRYVADRSLNAFRARLEDAALVEDHGTINNGPHEACTVHVLTVRSSPISEENAQRYKPLRPEMHVGVTP
jgi:hypothetical protein